MSKAPEHSLMTDILKTKSIKSKVSFLYDYNQNILKISLKESEWPTKK